MLPIANQPILFYGLKHLARAGIREVGIVLGPLHEEIQETVGDGAALGLHVQYIYQGEPKGLAHAVLCAREFLGEAPFVMYLGDNLLQEGVEQFLRIYEAQHVDAVVGATPVANPQQYGIVELDGDRILSIEEKPAHPRSKLALIGVYLLGPAILPIIEQLTPSKRGELEITEAIWKLASTGGQVVVHPVQGWWKDTGRPEDLLDANELVLRSLPPPAFASHGAIARGASISGNVAIGPGTVIESQVEIIGPVVIGAGGRIGEGSRIGPATSLGDGVVLSATEIHRSIVMDGARIHGPLRLCDSLIGRNVEIQMQGTVDHEISLTIGDAARLRL